MHRLNAPLVVSLASYGPRFGGLALAVKSLLTQTIKPDLTVLWVDAGEIEDVPREIRALENDMFQIKSVQAKIRSYKKLVPALRAFPEAFIVTADDDVIYRPDWLETLVGAYAGKPEVICSRAHRIRLRLGRYVHAYSKWEREVEGGKSRCHFATGVGGIMYPPRILADEVLNQEAFVEICPTGDDIWFYWMARMNGFCARKVGPFFFQDFIPNSQIVSLYKENDLENNRNDVQIKAMIKRYGRVW